jgi:Tfp pilus assembly ATPase PilU
MFTFYIVDKDFVQNLFLAGNFCLCTIHMSSFYVFYYRCLHLNPKEQPRQVG